MITIISSSLLVLSLAVAYVVSDKKQFATIMFVAFFLLLVVVYKTVPTIIGWAYIQILLAVYAVFIISLMVNTTKKMTVLGDGGPVVSLWIVFLTAILFWGSSTFITDNTQLDPLSVITNETIRIIDVQNVLIKYRDMLAIISTSILSVLLVLVGVYKRTINEGGAK